MSLLIIVRSLVLRVLDDLSHSVVAPRLTRVIPEIKQPDRAAPCCDRHVVHGLVVRSPFSFLQLTNNR